MSRKMLIDATHEEETRVAVMEGNRLVEYDYESKSRKPLKGSIFLAKVTRVEPSLQAAFVNFGGNRHGFLPFSEIHPDYFRIPIADREALLAEQQAALEEMEAREAEEDAEARAEEAGMEDSAPAPATGENVIEHAEDEPYEVEEIGGEQVISLDEMENPEAASPAPQPQEQAEEDYAMPAGGDGSISADETDDESFGNRIEEPEYPDDNIGNVGSSDEERGSFNGDDDQGHGREEGRGRGRGRGRFRRGRGPRGRGHGHHRRAAHSSKRVESFGGEDHGDDGRFRFNLRRKYKIQEVIKRGQIMLVQVSKEERGNKGAAVTSYLSLPGRYCVLMPNSPRAGGVSRKIANYKDRARMREMMKEMEVPQGMSVIVRTAGVSRTKVEIKRDLDYLMRLWDNIRELTLQSSAPAMVYEEADLIKRAVRDLYTPDVEEIVVSGDEGFKTARNFMKMMIPSHVKRVVHYENQEEPLFHRYKAEAQIAEIGEAQVTLPSGGYLVINPTEALVSIDVNSGKATKERHIEETALKTNLEAASEIARQLRMRDLGGLIVVDFIDMEDRRNNAKVERRMRDSLSGDRARIQMGRISSFGLMELSRQRLNPSLAESQFELCKHCNGIGRVRTADGASIMVLRAIEDEGIKGRAAQVIAHVPANVALYILNNKRKNLTALEERYKLEILIRVDESLGASGFRVEVSRPSQPGGHDPEESDGDDEEVRPERNEERSENGDNGERRRRRGRRGGRRRRGRENGGEHGSGRQSFADDMNEDAEDFSEASREENDNGFMAQESAQDDERQEEVQEKSAPRRSRRQASAPQISNDDAPEMAEQAEEPQAPPPPRVRDYETVNEEPKEKKKGWWNRKD